MLSFTSIYHFSKGFHAMPFLQELQPKLFYLPEGSWSRLVENSINCSIKFTTTWSIAKWTDDADVTSATTAMVKANTIVDGLTCFFTSTSAATKDDFDATTSEIRTESTPDCTSPATAPTSQCPTVDASAADFAATSTAATATIS
jgi:hypothetical protein